MKYKNLASKVKTRKIASAMVTKILTLDGEGFCLLFRITGLI
jgi:hypothetical protein